MTTSPPPPDKKSPTSFPTKPSNEVSEEAAIFNTFMLVIRNKFVATPRSPSHEVNDEYDKQQQQQQQQRKVNRLDDLYKSSAYQAEKKLLSKINNNGMAKGLGVGLVTFLFLRRGPRLMSRYIMNQQRQQRGGGMNGTSSTGKSGYHFDINSTSTNNFQQIMDEKPSLFMRTIKFGLDVFVSMSIAMYGSIYFTDKHKLMNDLSNIPLVEGRSLISDELCDDFIDVYKAIPKRIWDKYDGKSEPLDAISQFVKNCLRRKIVEKELLEEKKAFGSFGIDGDDDKHVDIPSPGVSNNIDVEIPWIDKSEDLTSERSVDEDDFDGNNSSGSDFDFNWNADHGRDERSNGNDNNQWR